MANYNEERAPKDVLSAAKKVAANAFLAAILCIIVYSSVLLLFRSFISPNIIGYTEKVQTFDEEGNLVSEEITNIVDFEKGSDSAIPENTENKVYTARYGLDIVPTVLSQILCMIVQFVMVYSVAWAFGTHQHNAFEFGRAEKNYLEGAKIGLYSSVAGITTFALMILAKFGICENLIYKIFVLVNGTYLPLLNILVDGAVGGVSVISKTPQDLSWAGLCIMLVPILLKVLVCYAGYVLGFKGISLKETIIYKKKINS